MNALKTENHVAERYIVGKRITAFGKKIYRYTRQSAPWEDARYSRRVNLKME
jgi:hypothetical protein